MDEWPDQRPGPKRKEEATKMKFDPTGVRDFFSSASTAGGGGDVEDTRANRAIGQPADDAGPPAYRRPPALGGLSLLLIHRIALRIEISPSFKPQFEGHSQTGSSVNGRTRDSWDERDVAGLS